MAFVLLLIFILIYFIRPQDFWAYVQGERLVYITLGLSALIWAIKMLLSKKRLFRHPQSVFMLGMWAAAVLSTYAMRWQQFTLDMLIYFGKVVLIYYLVSDLIDSQGKLKLFAWFLTFSCAVLATLSILQYYGIDVIGGGARVHGMIIEGKYVTFKRLRGIGIFETNQLAYAMGLVLPLAFALFMTSRSVIGKILPLVFMAIFGYCAFLTKSRGGMIAFLIPVALFTTVRGGFTARFFTLLIAGLVTFTLISGSERFATVFRFKEDKSAKARFDAWYAGSLVFRQHPLIGCGVNRFKDSEIVRIVTHNGFVQVAAETGLVGLFFWSGLLYFSFRSLMRLQEKTPQTKEAIELAIFARCLFLAFIQFLVACIFSGDAFDFTFYLLIGAAVASEAIGRRYKLIEYKASGPGAPLISRRDVVKVIGVMMLILVTWKLSMMALL